jgi:acetylornithine deacetylase/succinyl-diaminopimelate desuccinylase-like protein
MTLYDEYREKVLAALDPAELIEFARGMVAIPSQCGIEPEEPCARYVLAKLAELGMQTELQMVQPGRPNAVGIVKGTGEGPSLMLNGHLDTTPKHMDLLGLPAVTVENGVMRGHGARNMKAGVAAMVMAAGAIIRARVPIKGDLSVAGVMGHHEGSLGTYHMIDRGFVPDYAIVPEPTDLAVRTIQTGNVTLRINVLGRSGSAGNMDMYRRYGDLASLPVDVNDKAFVVAQALKSVQWTYTPYPPLPDLPLLHLGGILTGSGPTYLPSVFVADNARLTVHVLTVPGQTARSVKADIERTLAALQRADPDLKATVEVMAKGPGRDIRLPLQVSNDALVAQALCRAHEQVTGQKPVLGAVVPNSYFGCDAQPLSVAGCQAVSYGPASHAYVWENRAAVKIDSMVDCARAIALASLEVLTSTRPG